MLEFGSGDGAPSYKICTSRLRPAMFLAVSRVIEKFSDSKASYVTELIFSSGHVGDANWSRFHRFFSHAAWDIDTFSMRLAKFIVTILSAGFTIPPHSGGSEINASVNGTGMIR
jgi:hypothetical protein